MTPENGFLIWQRELMRTESHYAEKESGKTDEGLSAFGHQGMARHAMFSVTFVLLYLILNRPEIIMVSQLGFSVWYPATGLILAVMLGISAWYFPLTVLAGALAGVVIYHQPLLSWSELVTPILGSGCYAVAALLLRGPLKIDPTLQQRRDVLLYMSVTSGAAVLATISGVASLVADRTISWGQYWHSAWSWYVGDVVALVSVAPFLLIHILPWVSRAISPAAARTTQNAYPGKAKPDRMKLREALEVVGQAVSMVLVLWITFGRTLGYKQLYYLTFVPIIWIAMRNGIRRVVTGLLALNFGIVIVLKLYPVPGDSLTKVGLLMLTVSGTGLIVGAAVSERHRMSNTGELSLHSVGGLG